jgi:hypothetical protein
MRLLMHLLAIIGLLGMTANVVNKVVQSEQSYLPTLQSAPHQSG